MTSSSQTATTNLPMPSPEEVIAPPLALFGVSVCVILFFYVFKHRHTMFQGRCCASNLTNPLDDKFFNKTFRKADDVFLTDRNISTLQTFNSFQNNFTSLLKIGVSPSVCLIFCPLTMYMYTPIVDYCWPKDHFSSPPNINDAIACFLVPAGMVYAFVFGFALQQVYGQYCDTKKSISAETDAVREIASLISCITCVSKKDAFRVLFLLKERIIHRILLIQNKSSPDMQVNVWHILYFLSDGRIYTDNMNAAVLQEIVRCLRILGNLSPGGIHESLHFFNWFFMETLSYFCFLGVLLIKTESYQMQLGMCIVTVVSITLLCYAVSDMNSPFHGFIRIDLSGLVDLVHMLNKTASEAQTNNKNVQIIPTELEYLDSGPNNASQK